MIITSIMDPGIIPAKIYGPEEKETVDPKYLNINSKADRIFY